MPRAPTSTWRGARPRPTPRRRLCGMTRTGSSCGARHSMPACRTGLTTPCDRTTTWRSTWPSRAREADGNGARAMLSFTLGKLIRALTVLLCVSFLTFIVAHSSGDPVRLIARGDATEQQKAQLRHSLGLDRPVLEQYGRYIAHALR